MAQLVELGKLNVDMGVVKLKNKISSFHSGKTKIYSKRLLKCCNVIYI